MNMLLQITIPFLDQVFLGEKVSDYLWFGGIILGTLLLKKPITAVLMRVSSQMAMKFKYTDHKNVINSMLFKPLERLLLISLLYVATGHLSVLLEKITFHHRINKTPADISLADVTDHIFLFLFIIFLTQVINSFIDFIYYIRVGRANEEKNRSMQQLLPLIKEMSKMLTWTMAIFWILGSVFHVNIPALITGLGIGGVAIALAGKETVENFFAAFTILSDKPFQTGETIKLGEITGVVERIGFRSTRLRNFDGSSFVIPNQNLVSQNLINLSARDIWNVTVIANIRYGITYPDLEKLIADVKVAMKEMAPIQEPIEVAVEGFDKETFQLYINYDLPHPMPEGESVFTFKRKVNTRIFQLISERTTLGTPVGTS